MKTKTFLIAAVTVLLTLSLSACAPAAPSKNGDQDDNKVSQRVAPQRAPQQAAPKRVSQPDLSNYLIAAIGDTCSTDADCDSYEVCNGGQCAADEQALLQEWQETADEHHAQDITDGEVPEGRNFPVVSRHDRIRNVELVGRLNLSPFSRVTDVWTLGKAAYVGGRADGTPVVDGTHVVDISDPTNPSLITTLPRPFAPFGQVNDVKASHVDTPSFTGDLLIAGLDPAGIQIFDVTNPNSPVLLSEKWTVPDSFMGKPAFGVHNLYPFQRGDRVYVLLAPYTPHTSTREGQFNGLHIVDITDPTNPVDVGRWSLHPHEDVNGNLVNASPDAPTITNPGRGNLIRLHDVWVSQNKETAYLSYWDAGYVILDISDVTNPRFVSITQWEEGAEGNAHSAVPAQGGNILITTDEDFRVNYPMTVTINPPSSKAGTVIQGTEALITTPLFELLGEELTAEIAWVGLGGVPGSEFGCALDPLNPFTSGPAVPYGENVSGKIALIKRAGGCRPDEKLAVAKSQGAIGGIMYNNRFSQPFFAFAGGTVDIPGGMIIRSDGEQIVALREANETVSVTLRPGDQSTFDPPGFARIWDISDLSNPVQLATIGEANSSRDRLNVAPPHNVFVRGNEAYFSWFGNELQVYDISLPANPRKIAEHDRANLGSLHGIHVYRNNILGSDFAPDGLNIYQFK